MIWEGHVTHTDERRDSWRVWCGNMKEKTIGRPRPIWEDNATIKLKDKNTRACTGLIWLRIETSGGSL
jgi:hypothetical protein